MGKSDRRRQKGQKRQHADRSRAETGAKASRGEGEAPREGKATVRAQGGLERAAIALSVLALFQCLLIVLLAIVVSFDWLNESGTGGDSLPLDNVAPAAPAAPPARGPALDASPLYLSPYEATELVKSAASIIGRFPVDRIRDTNTLRDVDISTPERVEHLKGLLRLSIEANMGGSLDISSFTDMLQLTPGSTLEAAGNHLVAAYQVAWSPD